MEHGYVDAVEVHENERGHYYMADHRPGHRNDQQAATAFCVNEDGRQIGADQLKDGECDR